MKRKFIGIVSLVVFVVVCLFMIFLSNKKKIVTIDIGYQSVTAQTWGALVMKAEGIFERRLNELYPETDFIVTWHDETSGAIINENMISLKYQFGFMGDLPCLINGNKGMNMEQYKSVFLCFDGKGPGGTNQSIICRSSDDINSIDDLKGKTVGVPIGSSAHRMLMNLLSKNQMSEQDVTLVHTEINVGYQMLKNGYIDAMCTWEPYGSIFLDDKELMMLISGSETEIDYLDGVMMNKDWADANSEYVDVFLASLEESHEMLTQRPEEASLIIANETGFDEKMVMDIVTNIKWEMEIKKEDIKTLNQGMKFLKKLGAIEEYDMESILYEKKN